MVARITPQQSIALGYETYTAVSLLEHGIDELWSLTAANDFIHLPAELLAQGMERLAKLTFCLIELDQTGVMPTAKTLSGTFGHDVEKVVRATVELAQQRREYADRPACRRDLEFPASDPKLLCLLELLSRFGKNRRYYHLDQFLDPLPLEPSHDPRTTWSTLERLAVTEVPRLRSKVARAR